jgi:transglutaminase-like putative cysteine protease
MGKRSSRWWDLPAALLLMVALLTAASRLLVTEWVDHLGVVQTLVFFGTLAGLALGYSLFSPWLAAVFGVLYGLFIVPWQLAITVGYISDEAMWSDRLVVLGERVINTLRQFVQQEPVEDPVLFLVSVAALAWALSVHAGYTLTRRGHPWRVIVPAGVAILVVQAADRYVPPRAWYVAAYFVFSLLLLARLTYLRLRQEWQQDGARIPPLMALDLSYVTLAVSVLLVLAAWWTAPAMAEMIPTAREAWQRSTEPVAHRLDALFASLRRRGPVLTVADYYSGTFSLGQGRQLTDALILGVQGLSDDGTAGRYYWRARVYDHYEDGKWSSVALTTTQEAGGPVFNLPLPELKGRRAITFAFTSPEPIVTLFAAPQPEWADKPVEVLLAENPDGTVDIAAFRADPPLSPGETYLARSSVSDVTVKQLRDADTDYPEWITGRYLQLPSTVTTRTHELARQLSADLETPYDVAAVVTEYLRLGIRYSETITDSAPADQEPLDWFLFDLRLGYCNYYASAEVVLLRSAGIPARLAVGFAEGNRRPGTNTYVVRHEDAHAWPEVYFPGLGWVEFEPTASEAPLVRPSGETGPADDTSPDEDPAMGFRDRLEEMLDLEAEEERPSAYSGEEPPPRRRPWVLTVAVLAAGLALLALGRWWRGRGFQLPPVPVLLETGLRRLNLEPPGFLRRWAERARLEPVQRAYLQVDRALVRLGIPPAVADTPAERTAALISILPLASEPAYRLLAEYQSETYSPRFSNVYAAREAARSIRKLSWTAKLRRLWGRRLDPQVG